MPDIADIQNRLAQRCDAADRTLTFRVEGRVRALTGLTVEVSNFAVPAGAQCDIQTRHGQIPAAAIGFRDDVTLLMPLADMGGIARGDRVRCRRIQATVPVGHELLGRVIDGTGHPIDGKGPLLCQTRRNTNAAPPPALGRARIDAPIGTGVRSIDALCTCGRGQRLGIFSGPGVGKSVLLGMIARYTSADVSVVSLVGERGREVREFIERDLGPEGLARSVVIVSTSDEPAPLRVQAAFLAATVAEYFRDFGNDVLLLMDSITRIALAQRQIGLAMGEPPATKGFTPSVFALLPRLVERAGKTDRGSITGFYTVLVEGDDMSEPVSDTMRGLLDGHLHLSRTLANRGQYPAVDMLESISRAMPHITTAEHQQNARDIQRLISLYRDIEDLLHIGAYAPGANAELDLAIHAHPLIDRFLAQGMGESSTFEQTVLGLRELIASLRCSVNQGKAPQAAPATTTASNKNQRSSENLGLQRMMAGL